MTYDKNEWVNGPTGGTPVTAEALNHAEEGIEDANDGNYVGGVFRIGPGAGVPVIPSAAPDSVYFVLDRRNKLNDASVVFRDNGDAIRGEIGVLGSADPDRDSDVHFKVVFGPEGGETFLDSVILLSPSGDVYVPHKVGVGTAPVEQLHVAVNQSAGRVLMKIENTNTGGGSQSAGFQIASGGVGWTWSTDVGQNGADNIALQSDAIGYTPVIMCTPAGRVGINTDSPAAALDVVGAVRLANQSSPPAPPSGGGVLYTQAGALKYIGSSGTVTTIAPA